MTWSTDFAEAMDCSVQYIGLLERGKQNLTLEKLAGIANILGVSVERLMQKPERGSFAIKKGRPRGPRV